MTSSSRRLRAATALAAAALLAACGGAPTAADPDSGDAAGNGPTAAEEVYEEVMALSGPERRDRLVELAAEEGQLNLYTSMTSDLADTVAEAFTDTFDIDVNLYRANGETVTQRVLQEQEAGYFGNDVVETDGIEMAALEQRGRHVAVLRPAARAGPRGRPLRRLDRHPVQHLHAQLEHRLVSAEDAPKSWEDLADPKWDGLLAMELGDVDWYLTLYNYWLESGKSEAEVDQLFADMADGAAAVKGHTVQAELMSAGQFGVVPRTTATSWRRPRPAVHPWSTCPSSSPRSPGPTAWASCGRPRTRRAPCSSPTGCSTRASRC